MSNKAKNKPIYKYSIHERLQKLTISEKQKALLDLPEQLNISVDQFYKYVYAKIDSNTKLSAESMLIIARYFNCTMEQMFSLSPTKTNKADNNEYNFLT